MRFLNDQNEEITQSECDLAIGYLVTETVIRPDATPIDNATKFAWADEDYETIQRYVVVPEQQRRAQRIAKLKRQLSATDYFVIKIAERVATPEEYADVIAQRQVWRAEINQLEGDGASDG